MNDKLIQISGFVNELTKQFIQDVTRGEFEYITFDVLFLEIRDFLLVQKADDLLTNPEGLKRIKSLVLKEFENTFVGFTFSNKITQAFELYFKI